MRTVAALYVDPRGPYPGMRDVECWDEKRDARRYRGPHSIVAHPPCGSWSKLRHLAQGADRVCGPIAVRQVRRWGGVLEQPAGSGLWHFCGLPRVGTGLDAYGGFSVEVDQVSWGHVARKRTWLYLVGIAPEMIITIRTGGEPTHWCSGGGTGKGKVPRGIKVCSPEQRRRTPVEFARYLVALARQAT